MNPGRNFRNLSLLLFIHAISSSQAVAADGPNAKDYTGEDGVLSKKEQNVYLLHRVDKTFFTYDKNRDGVIDAQEAQAILKSNDQTATTIAIERAALRHNAENKGLNPEEPLTPKQIDSLIKTIEQPTYTPDWFRMRAKVSDFRTPTSNRNDLLKLPAATFSYGRDYEKGSDTWTATGAVGGQWNLPGGIPLSAGAEFNRIDTNESGKADVDTLIFKALGSGMVMGNDFMGAATWNFGLDYGTNFDFEGGLLGLTSEVEPTWNNDLFTGVLAIFGERGETSAANSPALGARNFLHLESGVTVSDFPTSVAANDDYLRVGPRLETTFWPAGTNFPLSFNAAFSYYYDFLGNHDYRNFKVGADWRLDSLGHFVLRAEYVNGMTALLLQDQQTFLFSLGVRF